MLQLATDRERFQLLWQRNLLNGAADDSAAIHQQLLDAYSESQRVYHTLDHIEHCLELFDSVSRKLRRADAVELGIWFHDVIYQPGSPDNEQLSADFFMSLTTGAMPDSTRSSVYEMIMSTIHDDTAIDDADTKFLVDIDLSSFGLPWEEFIRDSEHVRKELSHIPDDVFYPKQAAFQKKLLDRPRFFKSDHFFEKYEHQARQNLADYFDVIAPKLQQR